MADINVVLGYGTFSIGGTTIALTRGGGQFMVEREYRDIVADGDYGIVKGRQQLIRSQAKLVVNALELLPANLVKMYPVTTLDTTTSPGHSILKGNIPSTGIIADADYQSAVTWTGRTADGNAVVISLDDAINLEGLDWTMVDKEDVVPQLTYTAAYDPATRTTEPWSVDFTNPA